MKKTVIAVLTGIAFLFVTGISWGGYVSQDFSVSWSNFDESLNDQPFNWALVDPWFQGPQTIELPLDSVLDGIVSAYFKIILGGSGDLEQPATAFLNGYNLGLVSIGDGNILGANIYKLDTWSLGSDVIGSLSPLNNLDIVVGQDGWTFTGAQLSGSRLVWEDDNGTAPVPEPATMILFATGLAGLIGVNAKKRKNKKLV